MRKDELIEALQEDESPDEYTVSVSLTSEGWSGNVSGVANDGDGPIIQVVRD